MKKLFKPIVLLWALAVVMAYGATSSAIYLHHQQSSLALLEADLQNREIGLDFANKTAVGKFADGTKFHLVSQEQPSVALVGNLIVSGNTTLSNGLTLSAQTANRPMWTNGSSQVTTNAPTGTGTTLVLSVSPTITGTLAAANGTYSGTLGVTGLLTASGGIDVSGGSSGAGPGRIYTTATGGTVIWGKAGSTYDFLVANSGAANVMTIATGTTVARFQGTGITVDGTAGIAGNITTTTGYLYTPITALPSFIMGSAGSNYGYLGNVNSTTWALGYTSSRTALGTSVLTWTDAGAVSIPGTATTTGVHTFTAAPVFTALTASLPMFTNGSKAATSNAMTGTGSVVMSTSPTLVTPALGAATATSIVASGNVTADSLISSKFYAEGTFTGTLTGVTGSVTHTVSYVRIGKQVTVILPAFIGTSNAGDCTITGMPASIRPTRTLEYPAIVADVGTNSTTTASGIQIQTSGTIALIWNGSTIGFTGSGTKGLVGITTSAIAQSITYTLQ